MEIMNYRVQQLGTLIDKRNVKWCIVHRLCNWDMLVLEI